jgi:DNA-binding NarL/FixJ family response regulator
LAGVYETAEPVYDIASELRDAVYQDTQIRFVAVRGAVGVVDADMSKVGGLVFKRASQLIGEAKTKGRFGSFMISSNLDQALGALVQSSNYLLESMTERQRKVYDLLKGGMTHEEIAKQFKVSRQAVTDAAKRGGTEYVLESEAAIRKLLETIPDGAWI